jgi:hypothetical protein
MNGYLGFRTTARDGFVDVGGLGVLADRTTTAGHWRRSMDGALLPRPRNAAGRLLMQIALVAA